MKFLSICITTFNRAKILKFTLKQIVRQVSDSVELIIVNDCSTDNTINILEEYISYDNVKIINNTSNLGLAASRNIAIRNSGGRFFTFVDDDDTWEDDYIRYVTQILEIYPDHDAYFFSKILRKNNERKALTGNIKDLVRQGYTPPVASQIYKTKVLLSIGGYDDKIKSGVDHDLWINLCREPIRFMWVNSNKAIVNSDTTMIRMTTSYINRYNKVMLSIQRWQKLHSNLFDSKFFRDLKINYTYNTFRNSVKGNNYRSAIYLFLKLNWRFFQIFPKDLIRYILIRLSSIKEEDLQPPLFFMTSAKNVSSFKIVDLREISE